MDGTGLKSGWARLNSLLPDITSFAWLYAPKKEAVFFSLRNVIASFLALAIALWLELDSPKWSIMTVWVVAQVSRGETIARSKWRVVGTIIGVIASVLIVAAFPQQPLLFGAIVAFWIGSCCFFATLIRSSGFYSIVLAGYTCSIIAFTAVSDPDNVFMLAMSRGTYIILAVLCQDFVERVFAYNQQEQAMKILNNNMLLAITGALKLVNEVMDDKRHVITKVREIFSAIALSRNTIEFRKAELSIDNHVTDHVHAALFSVVIVLVKLVNLSLYMTEFDEYRGRFKNICAKIHDYIDTLISHLEQGIGFEKHLQLLAGLRWECRQIIADDIYHDTDVTYARHLEKYGEDKVSFVNGRILYRALSELLGELEVVLLEYQATRHPKPHDRFVFKMNPLYNFKLAWSNGLRVFLAMLLACFIWEVTAWPEFASAIGILGMVCGRLCLFEDSYGFSVNYFKGMLLAMLVSALLCVGPLALANTIEMFCLVLFVPTFIGGLAIHNLSTRGAGVSFTTFVSLMTVVDNQSKVSEINFLNSTFGSIAATAIAIFAFRYFSPYSPKRVRWEIRQRILKNIHTLPTLPEIPNARQWLANSTDWFVSLMRQFNPAKEANLAQRYNRGALAMLTIGVNVIELRKMLAHDILSEDIKNELRVVLRRISQFRGRKHGRTILIVKSAIRRLYDREGREKNLSRRLEIGTAIGCLIPILHSLENNLTFLNLSQSDVR